MQNNDAKILLAKPASHNTQSDQCDTAGCMQLFKPRCDGVDTINNQFWKGCTWYAKMHAATVGAQAPTFDTACQAVYLVSPA